MNKANKFSKYILILGIVSVVFSIVAIPLMLLFMLTGAWDHIFLYFPLFPSANWEFVWTTEAIVYVSVGLTAGLISSILSIAAAILMLSTKFNNKSLDDLKIIMGILTLLIIGPIGAIVFGGIAMSKLKSSAATTTAQTLEPNNPIAEPII